MLKEIQDFAMLGSFMDCVVEIFMSMNSKLTLH